MPYLVINALSYPDDFNSYEFAANREEVEQKLVDWGWRENPGVYAYKITGPKPALTSITLACDLSQDPDPYPDWTVQRGPRGGVKWERA